MENKEMNSRVWDLFNIIRGKEDISKVIPAAIVVTRVKKRHLGDENIYEALREEASGLGVYSLFENQAAAIDIYMTMPDELDWGFLLQEVSEAAGKAMDISILPDSRATRNGAWTGYGLRRILRLILWERRLKISRQKNS